MEQSVLGRLHFNVPHSDCHFGQEGVTLQRDAMCLLDVTPQCLYLLPAVPLEVSGLFGGQRTHGLAGWVLHPRHRPILEEPPDVGGRSSHRPSSSRHFRVQNKWLLLGGFWLQQWLLIILFDMDERSWLRCFSICLRESDDFIMIGKRPSLVHRKHLFPEDSDFLLQSSDPSAETLHGFLHLPLQFSQTVSVKVLHLHHQ